MAQEDTLRRGPFGPQPWKRRVKNVSKEIQKDCFNITFLCKFSQKITRPKTVSQGMETKVETEPEGNPPWGDLIPEVKEEKRSHEPLSNEGSYGVKLTHKGGGGGKKESQKNTPYAI